MFVFGIVMALVGAVLTPLSTRLKFEVADIGTLFLAMNCAMLVCSFGVGLVMDRWGTKAPIVVGPLLVGSALALFARANVFNELLPAGVLLGLGGGALNAATNTLIADIHDEASKHSALNVLGVFYGVGALFLPFTIGALMTSLGIVNLLWIAAGLCLVFGLFALPLRFPAPHPGHASVSFLEMLAFLRLPVVIVMAGLLFLQSGSEFTLGGYLTTFLTRDLLVSVTSASVAAGVLLECADAVADRAGAGAAQREPAHRGRAVRHRRLSRLRDPGHRPHAGAGVGGTDPGGILLLGHFPHRVGDRRQSLPEAIGDRVRIADRLRADWRHLDALGGGTRGCSGGHAGGVHDRRCVVRADRGAQHGACRALAGSGRRMRSRWPS